MSIDFKNRKKTNLLKFQQGLNEQFLEIFYKKNDLNETNLNIDTLGLTTSFRDLNLFISLETLQTIATKLNYENSIRTKSWVLGFNQEHGKIYTIFNMNKVFSMLIENETDFSIPHVNLNSHIVYLQTMQEENHGLLLEEFKLDYTAEFTLLFDALVEDEIFSWKLSEDIDFDTFIKRKNMSKIEWELVNKIKELEAKKEKFQYGIYPEYNKEDKLMLLALMVNKVYLDSFGKKPVFMLDIKNLTKFLINVSPF